jgi:hypothetical protein
MTDEEMERRIEKIRAVLTWTDVATSTGMKVSTTASYSLSGLLKSNFPNHVTTSKPIAPGRCLLTRGTSLP